MKIEKTTIENIKDYRNDYLNSLHVFQELFIELMVCDSACYILKIDNEMIGYVIKNYDGILIEFYVADNYVPGSNVYFKQVLEELSIKEIYCKSFDSLLLDTCLLTNLTYAVIGVLYRDHVAPSVKIDTEISMKKAGLSSVGLLQGQDDSIKELFETEQQLVDFIQNENVFEFYRDNTFIGCGMVLRTNPDWDFCDLGVWVRPSQRGNSFGSQILLNLRDFALRSNLKPCCGCAIENVASQKTIEKSGFVSRYKLIKFKTN